MNASQPTDRQPDSDGSVARAASDSQSGLEINADSIAHGVALMLILTVVQRTVGFVRNVAVCRFLDPSELGMWNLAESFLILAAPLIIFGIPGSFGRYVEHYRQRGQLRGFLRNTLSVTTVIAFVGVALLLVFRSTVAKVAFGSAAADEYVIYTVATLVAVIAYNIGGNLLTALRQLRANAGIQFINSFVFSVVAIALLATTTLGAKAVLLAYLIACVLTTVGSVFLIRSAIAPLSKSEATLPSRTVWTKLGPYIGWFWLSDLLMNAFNWIDRLMIVHCAGLNLEDATAMIGQYHSSRIIGVLMISVTGMLGSVLLSYLSHDWEAGRRAEAESRLDFALRLVAVAMTAVAVATMAFAPIIFGWLLQGEFKEGFEVLHVTLAYCIWYGLLTLAANYIWCHERPVLACAAVLVGILVNIGLNYVLLPRWGLAGAVTATAFANLAILTCVGGACRALGFAMRRGTIIAILLPGCLCFGSVAALACMIAALWHGIAQGWLFSSEEITQIRMQLSGYLERLPKFGMKPVHGT